LSDRAARLIMRFAWRGFTVVNFCPGCMRPILSLELVKMIGRVWMEQPQMVTKIFDNVYGVAGFAVFIPGNEEQAQLLNHRYVIYPICYECASHLRELGFLEKIEENIILARRRAKLFKSDDGWLWWGLETS